MSDGDGGSVERKVYGERRKEERRREDGGEFGEGKEKGGTRESGESDRRREGSEM